jgi:glycosyltransferase involved in cell wall biosynthesis
MSTPLVSVVIPTYNRVRLLQEAIDSALAQTYDNIEVIVTDDGSTDGTRDLIASYTDPRIRYRRNRKNLGQTMNNRAAFVEARGTYVANLHDDDRWTPHFLETLVPRLEAHPEASVAFCDHYVTSDDGTVHDAWTEENTRYFGRDTLAPGLHRPFHHLALIDLSIPVVMGSVMRKGALDLNDVPGEVEPIYDLWLAYLLCRDGHAAIYVSDRLTYYRVHGSQESGRSTVQKSQAHVFCFNRFVADDRLQAIGPALVAERAQRLVGAGIELLCDGRPRDARPLLVEGLRSGVRRAAAPLLLSFLPPDRSRRIAVSYRQERRSLLQSIKRGFAPADLSDSRL